MIQIQQAIFTSPDFEFVIKYIESENEQAYEKQKAYRRMKDEQKEKLKVQIEKNFAESKARYDGMKKSFYSRWAGVAFKRSNRFPPFFFNGAPADLLDFFFFFVQQRRSMKPSLDSRAQKRTW